MKNPETQMLIDINQFIHKDTKQYEYHMKHLDLVRKYAIIINKKLSLHIDNHKLTYIAYAHDILKERGLNPNIERSWKNHPIPEDLNRYIRTNLNTLEVFGLEDYFNTDIQQHALAAGIFLYKELEMKDMDILYPVMFHTCPIIPVYKELRPTIRNMVDIILLADKLSSNYLRINMKKSEVKIDLDQLVFGSDGKEFNYSLGLFVARLIGQGNSNERNSIETTEYYLARLRETNPLIGARMDSAKKLGGNKIWPERKSKVLSQL